MSEPGQGQGYNWVIVFSQEGHALKQACTFTTEQEANQQRDAILMEDAKASAGFYKGPVQNVRIFVASPTTEHDNNDKTNKKRKRAHASRLNDGIAKTGKEFLSLYEQKQLGDQKKFGISADMGGFDYTRISKYSLTTTLIVAHCDAERRAPTAEEWLTMYKADPKALSEEHLGVAIIKTEINKHLTQGEVVDAGWF